MNIKLFLISILVLCAFPFSVYTYITTFQAEIADAYSTSKPINGHYWIEMECNTGLCVTGGNKVGIGTENPTEELEVVGDVLVSGDACNKDNYCLSDLEGFF